MDHRIHIEPVTPDRWDDLLALFGPNGAYSHCWCTWWMLPARSFDSAPADERKAMLQALVAEGAEPGIIAYSEDEPVGWVAVGPRERYVRMMSARARVYGPLDDDEPGWVVNCFYISRPHRRRGVAGALLDGAVAFAFGRGASHVVGHPIDVKGDGPGAAALFVGTLALFVSAGFEVVEQRGDRPVVQLDRPRSGS